MERVIKMPVDNTYRVISFRDNHSYKELFIMTGINEDEYNKLKKSITLTLIRGNFTFTIPSDDVLCYGEIDFHEGSDDCKELDTFNWLEHLGIKGVCIPSRYNYDKHECSTDRKSYLYTETWRNSHLCRYLHGCLGKPQFTLIFREVK